MKFGKGEDDEDLKIGSVGSVILFSLDQTKIKVATHYFCRTFNGWSCV